MIYNFSTANPNLLSIRKNPSAPRQQQGEQTEEALIWNLGFILDHLMSQAQQKEPKTGKELKLINLINTIIE